MNTEWTDRAACREVDGDLFFPHPGGASLKVRYGVCDRCIVQGDCLEAALSSPWMPSGVWGGLREDEVRRMWSERKREARRLRRVEEMAAS